MNFAKRTGNSVSAFLFALFLLLANNSLMAQNVAINKDGSPPDKNAMLDIQSNTKGLLIPRMTTEARLRIPNTQGLIVYDISTNSFWYNTGRSWQNMSAIAHAVTDSAWLLTGNAGTSSTGAFIGTTDNAPFVVRVNNQRSGLIDPLMNNTIWGFRAGSALNMTVFGGSGNTAIGAMSLMLNGSGAENVAVGISAMQNNLVGGRNVAIGYRSMFASTTGTFNTAVGSLSLTDNTTGQRNVAVGKQSLTNNTTGNDNTVLGYRANTSSGGLTNATAIGADALVNASNKVRIGNSAVTVIEGQVPFTTPSDGRYKFGVQEDVKGLAFIMQLRPVTYHFDVKRFDEQLGNHETNTAAYDAAVQLRRTGFIAQEVEQAAVNSGYDFSGVIKPRSAKEHYSLSYDAFVVPLVKAVQEQQAVINAQQQQLQEQQRVNETLNKQLDELQRQMNEIKKALKVQ